MYTEYKQVFETRQQKMVERDELTKEEMFGYP